MTAAAATKKTRKPASRDHFPSVEMPIVMPRTVGLLYPSPKNGEKPFSPFHRSLRSLELLKIWGQRKNPFAAWFAIEAEAMMQTALGGLEQIIDETVKLRNIEEGRSGLKLRWIEPSKTPRSLRIHATSAQAYWLFRVIMKYDKAERFMATLERCGVQGSREYSDMLHKEAERLRALFHRLLQSEKMIGKHRLEHATKDKLAADGEMRARADAMQDEIGEKIPEDILEGKRTPEAHLQYTDGILPRLG